MVQFNGRRVTSSAPDVTPTAATTRTNTAMPAVSPTKPPYATPTETPTVIEFVRDEATRRQLELLMVSQTMDRPVLAPPGVPAERVRTLRDALIAVTRDDAFRADVERRNLQVDPLRGEDMTAMLQRAFFAPPEVIAAARETMGGR